MKLKRLISLLLLSVYLLATGGPAYVSLSCKCVAMKARAAHVCCHHCQHGADTSDGTASLKATCCGNHHSTEINLYTFSQDSEKSTRCTVTDLPPSRSAGRKPSDAAPPSSNGAMSAARDSAPLPYWLKTLLGRMLRASVRNQF